MADQGADMSPKVLADFIWIRAIVLGGLQAVVQVLGGPDGKDNSKQDPTDRK